MDKPKVLIVEDNQINALVLRRSIESVCHPIIASNDEETFQAVEEESAISLILMDINLGGKSMTGEEIMRVLRRDDRFRHIKIFAVTSYAMPGDRERFLEAGFDSYFAKPIDREEIVHGIRQVVAAA
ncbi:MAG: hypothetical protein OHK0039_16670 [Bacteroidia bacterium]